ncbi:hypothetical protein ACQCVB_19515 [Fictibacillus phosphorivorans]|uniref:hypothetical protein n=1 Tax=Fictibacillus phosphorivorans TaxID=1221500 RepID=UPI003CF63A93
MYTVLLILSILTLGFLIFKRTTRYKWMVLSILPFVPSLTFVITEIKQNAFWIMLGFFFIYTACFLCLFLEYMLLNKTRKH